MTILAARKMEVNLPAWGATRKPDQDRATLPAGWSRLPRRAELGSLRICERASTRRAVSDPAQAESQGALDAVITLFFTSRAREGVVLMTAPAAGAR